MKKSVLVKFRKITLLVCALLMSSLFVWANWDPKTYSQTHVADSRYIVFDLSKGNISARTFDVEKKLSLIDGVSTCSYNSSSKVIGIIYYRSKISSYELKNRINSLLGFQVTEKFIEPQKNGCPVGGVKYIILSIKQSLNFRS